MWDITEFVNGTVRYYGPAGVFIDHPATAAHRAACGWPYTVYLSGASKGGCALSIGGAYTLRKAQRLALEATVQPSLLPHICDHCGRSDGDFVIVANSLLCWECYKLA